MSERKHISYEHLGHRPTDLMSGITELLKYIYPKDIDKGIRVLKVLTEAMESEQERNK